MDDEQSPAPDDPILSSLTDTEDTAEPVVEETVEEVDVEETETPPEGEQPDEDESEEEPELDPKEEARRRYEERQASIAQRRERISDQSEEYVKQSEDEYDQRLRQMEVQQYSAKIEQNENNLLSEFDRVKANPDLQLFNPDNKTEFNQRAYDKAIKDFNAGYISYDQRGNMTEIKGSLLEHLTEASELYQGFTKNGQVKQVRATQRMRSSADVKPAASPKETAKDTLMEILKADD